MHGETLKLVVLLFSKLFIPSVSFDHFHHFIDRYLFTLLSCFQCR